MNNMNKDNDYDTLTNDELEKLVRDKMDELRKVSHPDVSEEHLRCAAKYALGLNRG